MRRLGLVLIAIFLLIAAYQALSYQLTTGEDRVNPYEILYEELLEKYNMLKQEHEELQEELSSLKSKYNALVEAYNELLENNTRLKKENAELFSKNNELRLKLKQLECLKAQWDKIVAEINARTLNGPWARDFLRQDVNFSVVGSFKNFSWVGDVKKVVWWIITHVKYTLDAPYPYITILGNYSGYRLYWHFHEAQYAMETVKRGVGDCEDQAILAVALLKHYFRDSGAGDVYIICIWDPKIKEGHAATLVLVFSERKVAIIDPVIRHLNLVGEGINIFVGSPKEALSSWLKAWRSKLPNAKLDRIIGVDEYKEFYYNEEFLSWLREKFS